MIRGSNSVELPSFASGTVEPNGYPPSPPSQPSQPPKKEKQPLLSPASEEIPRYGGTGGGDGGNNNNNNSYHITKSKSVQNLINHIQDDKAITDHLDRAVPLEQILVAPNIEEVGDVAIALSRFVNTRGLSASQSIIGTYATQLTCTFI